MPARSWRQTGMTIAQTTPSPSVDEQVGALAERMFESGIAAVEVLTVYVGLRLGLYGALADGGPATPAELAERAGIHPRYATEWLEQQTVAGFVTCDDRHAASAGRTYRLPEATALTFLQADHPASTAPIALAFAGVASVLPDLLAAYRSGDGVPYSRYGADFRDGQAGFNHPAFAHLLAGEWLAGGAPEVDARLRRTGAIVADVACGCGWSSISLAQAYPDAIVHGFDVDEASIADARRNAALAGVSDRVRFEVRDATLVPSDGERGRYDVITIFEALHDMAHPVEALRACRELLAGDGAMIVMDEKTAETFAESDGPIERFLYGVSVLHCLPVGMAEPDSAGTGTVMRPSTLRGYATSAGFSTTTVLPIEHDLFRFYRLEA